MHGFSLIWQGEMHASYGIAPVKGTNQKRPNANTHPFQRWRVVGNIQLWVKAQVLLLSIP